MKNLKKEEGLVDDILSRGVEEFIDPENFFRKKIESNPEKIIIKFGVDPTRPDIHLGHAVVLRKLRQFQDLGCKVVFLIGDYTTQIGDPTGRSKVRPELDQQEIEKNMKTYLDQVGKILSVDKKVFSWIRNSDWFTAITDLGFPKGTKIKWDLAQNNKKISIDIDANTFFGKALSFEKTRMQVTSLKLKNNIMVVTLKNFLWSLRHITHSELIQRDMFQERLKNKEELFMHEMMYPVLQGIDSFVLGKVYQTCDLEVGGADQTFNMLMGRHIMKMNGQKPQAVIAFKILEGLDGKEKMSKSLDNYISITDEPSEMYGKIMSIPDSSIMNYFELCTFTPLIELEEIKKSLTKSDKNPKDLKMSLAKQIVSIYHGEKKSNEAETDWISKFEKREIPGRVEEIKNLGSLMETLVVSKTISSKTEARRLFEAGAITDLNENRKLSVKAEAISSHVYKIGKHKFVKVL